MVDKVIVEVVLGFFGIYGSLSFMEKVGDGFGAWCALYGIENSYVLLEVLVELLVKFVVPGAKDLRVKFVDLIVRVGFFFLFCAGAAVGYVIDIVKGMYVLVKFIFIIDELIEVFV